VAFKVASVIFIFFSKPSLFLNEKKNGIWLGIFRIWYGGIMERFLCLLYLFLPEKQKQASSTPPWPWLERLTSAW